MKIDWDTKTYYDVNGVQLKDGDRVFMDGRVWDVMLTEDGYLGVDSTNPQLIEIGRAAPGQYGVYTFSESDEPKLWNDSEYIPYEEKYTVSDMLEKVRKDEISDRLLDALADFCYDFDPYGVMDNYGAIDDEGVRDKVKEEITYLLDSDRQELIDQLEFALQPENKPSFREYY